MIEINNIESNKYSFPTIDFKFQNTGNATAFLWRFSICIEDAEINVTPAITLSGDFFHDFLIIKATNNGWGTAKRCHFSFENHELENLFNNGCLNFDGDIKSGETRTIIELSLNNAIKDYLKSTGYKINLERLHGKLNYLDENNNSYEEEKCIFGLSNLFLTSNGFETESFERFHTGINFCVRESDITYVTMLDPLSSFHEKSYSISRGIPPGDLERFHILIGSKISSNYRLKFKFNIDESSVIKSDEFIIKIWNPINSYWTDNYRDGAELDRLNNTKSLSSISSLMEYSKYLDQQIIASNFPFQITPKTNEDFIKLNCPAKIILNEIKNSLYYKKEYLQYKNFSKIIYLPDWHAPEMIKARRWIASLNNLPLNIIDALANDEVISVRASLWENPNISKNVKEKLNIERDILLKEIAKSSSKERRKYLATQTDITEDQIRILSKDDSYIVRMLIAKRNDLPDDVIEELKKDQFRTVRNALGSKS